MAPAPSPFVRDRLTLAVYAVTGAFAMLLGFIGPLMPHLREQLSLGYAEAALHTSAFAIGMIACGLVGDRVVARIGRDAGVWFGMAGMSVGLTMLALAPSALVSIAGCGLMGLAGTLMVVVIPAVLSEHHGENSGFAFAEQNLTAYVGALFAPVLVWAFAVSASWRWSALVGWILLAGFAVTIRSVRLPPPVVAAASRTSTLPRGYWAFWTLLCITVATEFCVLVWSSSYLETVLGLSRENAVLSTAVFPVAMILSRLAGTMMLRRIRVGWLVLPSLTLGFVGFMIFWKAPAPALSLFGLFLTGLGVANLYPAGIALAMAAAGPATSAASARASLASGIAIIAAPLTLGALADRVGIAVAYGAVPFLFAIGVLAYSIGRRAPAGGP
jgi:fucose permease